MDQGLPTKTKRSRHPDRITIDPEPLMKLDVWMKHLLSKHKGIQVTRRDLVNWLIKRHSEELSRSEEEDLKGMFYDEERFLRYAWEEIKAAKARGEKLSLQEILQRKEAPPIEKRPRKKSEPKNAKQIETMALEPIRSIS